MADQKSASPAGVWPTVKPFVNGGASGMLATCVIQPIDMIKVPLFGSFILHFLFLFYAIFRCFFNFMLNCFLYFVSQLKFCDRGLYFMFLIDF